MNIARVPLYLGEEFLCRLFLQGVRNLQIRAECFSRVKTAQLKTLFALQRDACAMATSHDTRPKRYLPLAGDEDVPRPPGKRQREDGGRHKGKHADKDNGKGKQPRHDKQQRGGYNDRDGRGKRNTYDELQQAKNQWTAEEFDRIMKAKACLGCGKTGHRFAECRKWAAAKKAKAP